LKVEAAVGAKRGGGGDVLEVAGLLEDVEIVAGLFWRW